MIRTTRFSMPGRRAAATAVLALSVGTVAACSNTSAAPSAGTSPTSAARPSTAVSPSTAGSAPSGSPSAGASTANDADVTFAQMMIPHHRQAVQMSDLLLAKTGLDPRVQKLAELIRAEQAPEITTMTGWLTSWGAPTAGSMGGMDDGGSDGMLTQTQLLSLKSAPAATAQQLYLQGMIGHHRGAVAMAQTEIANGSDPDAIALARSIVRSQNEEITTMTELLPKL